MALLLASMRRTASGAWIGRKVIPKDCRDEYERLYGQHWEAKLTLTAETSARDAKIRWAEWLSVVEAQIKAIRDNRDGKAQALSERQALALAGEWYRQFTQTHEENPGEPERWDKQFWALVERLEEAHPDYPDIRLSDLDHWIREPEVREGIRPVMAKEAKAEQFLVSRGLSLTQDAYNLFLDRVLELYIRGVSLLERRANRDYSTDEVLQELPAASFDRPKPKPKNESDATPWLLFEQWIAAAKPANSTINRWRAVFVDLEKFFKGAPASTIGPDDALAWAEQLVDDKRTAITVNGVWTNAARRVFAWAVERRKLISNPFVNIAVTEPRKVHTRETKAFRLDSSGRRNTSFVG